MPHISKSMKDGWETKVFEESLDLKMNQRNRDLNHTEWIIIQLGHSGYLKTIEIDTRHFKGNCPDMIKIEGCFSPGVLSGTISESNAKVLVVPVQYEVTS